MKKLKAMAGIMLVFVLGGIAGGLVSLKVCHYRAWERPPVSAVMRHLDRKLGLDPDQHRQIEAIIRDARTRMNTVRKETEPRIDSIMADAQGKIRTVLRPEQREKFEKLVRERKEKRERMKGKDEN